MKNWLRKLIIFKISFYIFASYTWFLITMEIDFSIYIGKTTSFKERVLYELHKILF